VLSRFRGSTLQIPMGDVRSQGMHALTMVLVSDPTDSVNPPRSKTPTTTFDRVMSASSCHLPPLVVVRDQRDDLTNELIKQFKLNQESHGSFADRRTASAEGHTGHINGVISCCALLLCSLAVLSRCALSLCSLVVLSRCAFSLCSLAVLSCCAHCALLLCSFTVLSHCALTVLCALSL
jgi:hypothetical protein